MTKYTFPKSNNQFKTWFTKFQKAFASNAKTFRFSPAQVRACKAAWSNWSKAYATWQKAHIAEQAALKACNQYRAKAEAVFGRFASSIRKSPFNRGQFASFGIPGKSNGKPHTAPKATRPVKGTPAGHPYVKVAWNSRGKNTIWVGSRPGGSGKWPSWAYGATVQYRYSNGPWRTLNSGSSWPFVHACGSKWASAQYRACFYSKTGTKGAWGPAAFYPAKSKAA